MRYIKSIISPGFTADQLDNEFQKIQTAIDDTLSRVGDLPNHMVADFDMNSQRIINLPDAQEDHEPLTLGQFENALISGNFNVTVQGTIDVQLDDATVDPSTSTINFEGNTAVVSNGNDKVTVIVPALNILDSGAQQNTNPTISLDFTSGNVTVTETDPGEIEIDVQTQSNLTVEDNGTPVITNTANTLNFSGAGVSVIDNGSGEAEIIIPGGAAATVNSVNGKTGNVTLDYGDFAGGENIVLQNAFAVRCEDNGATPRNVVRIEGDNTFALGNSAVPMETRSSAVPEATYGGQTYEYVTTEGGQTISGPLTLDNANLDIGTGTLTAANLNVSGGITQGALTVTDTGITKLISANRTDNGEAKIYVADIGAGVSMGIGSGNLIEFTHTDDVGDFLDYIMDAAFLGATRIYHAGGVAITTTSTGMTAGAVQCTRNAEGALDVVRSSTSAASALIRNNEGGVSLYTDAKGFRLYQTNSAGAKEDIWLETVADAGVTLRYNNQTKLATTNTGATVTGTLIATAFNATSAAKYKKDIDNIQVDSLDVLDEIRAVQFRWIEAADAAGRDLVYGFIADEVEKVIPNVVYRDKDGEVAGMDYNSMIALLWDQNKLLKSELERQDCRIRQLENQMEALLHGS